MKKIFFLLAFVLAFASIGKSQNLIAVEHGSTTTFYANIDSALILSQNGDKVYFPGGNFATQSSDIQINKQLQIYGVGYNIDSTISTLNTIFLKGLVFLPGSSGSTIVGVDFGSNRIQIYDSVNNINISRCTLGNLVIGSHNYSPPGNISLIQCVISNIQLFNTNTSNAPTVFIGNCCIGMYSNNYPIQLTYNSLYWSGLVCKNSYLKGNDVSNLPNSVFENCIIERSGWVYNSYMTYKNCIFKLGSGLISNPSTGLYNCFYNVFIDTIFVLKTGISFSIRDDYNLKANSPYRNAGTDGTDIGLFGGSFAWKNGGLPATPHIQYKIIKNKTDGNGNLPVQIKVKAQDN